jgi:predicted NUDIX family NTP pyrophosphohydrolase
VTLIESAGIILYRRRQTVEIFLIHMGGPIWARRDEGAWSIPKGVIGVGEAPLVAAKREFWEETGFVLEGEFKPLGRFEQNSGKHIFIWAVKGDCDPGQLVSQTFSMVWPPKSGKLQQYPEADRGDWFDRKSALAKIVRGQRAVVEHFYKMDRSQDRAG